MSSDTKTENPLLWKYEPPFRVEGFYVLDSLGGTICVTDHVDADEMRAQLAWLERACELMNADAMLTTRQEESTDA